VQFTKTAAASAAAAALPPSSVQQTDVKNFLCCFRWGKNLMGKKIVDPANAWLKQNHEINNLVARHFNGFIFPF
jgi:hypothetical protein